MIDSILPPPVVAVERYDDRDAELLPEEARLTAGWAEKRKSEFATVRRCARDAMAKLGVPPAPLLRDPAGAPRWPAGIVGSMTHCAGYRAAAVASSQDVSAVGIDAEPDAPLPPGVLELVTDAVEREHLDALASGGGVGRGGCGTGPCWQRLAFSAKEALYKAWHPLTGRWLDFSQARVAFTPDGRFTATVLVAGARLAGRTVNVFEGRWVARDGLLATAIVVERSTGTAERKLRT